MSETNCPVSNVSILIADDNEDTLDVMKFSAKLRRWNVDVAKTASEIIEKVNSHVEKYNRPYDVIIADIHYFSDNPEVPRISGITAAKSIREIYRDIPIIFVTGFSSPLIEEEAKKYSNEIIEKPIDVEQVLDRCEYYVRWASRGNYEGPERRRLSINRTRHRRRFTDCAPEVKIDQAVMKAIEEVRVEKYGSH